MAETAKDVNKRALRVFEGIFFILLGAAMSLHMGYVIRSFNAFFLTLMGHAIYLFIALIVLEGFFLIIRGKLLLLSKGWKTVPFIILVLGILMLISTIEITTFGIVNDDIIRDYFRLFKQYDTMYPDGGYYARTVMNLFDVPFGGGLLGYLLAVPFVQLTGKIPTFIIAGVLIALMLFILLRSHLKRFFKYLANRKYEKVSGDMEEEHVPTEKKPKKEKKPKETKPKKERKPKEKHPHSFDKETDPLSHASEVGVDEVTSISSGGEITPFTFSSMEEDDSTPIRTIRPSSDTGTLELAQINLFGEFEEGSSVTPPTIETPKVEVTKEEIKEEIPEVVKEEVAIIETTVEETPVVEEKPAPTPKVVPTQTPTPKVEVVREEKPKPVVTPKVEEEDVPPPVEVKTSTKVEWIPPSTEALETYQTEEQVKENINAAKEKQEIVNQVFRDFNIQAEVVDFVIGPSITRLLIDYPSTGSIKAVDKIKIDVQRRLRGVPIRFEETVPDTPYSGFEVPNPVKATVSFKEVFEALPDPAKHPTAVPFGKDITGKVIYADVCDFPHMLVSGTSGSGKSVFVNALITTLICRTSPNDLKLVLVDPKRIEMNRYREEPHLLCPVINEPPEARVMLFKMVDLMNQRYRDFEEADCATSIKDYNYWAKENNRPTMPYIIIVLDEYSDLAYTCKDISTPLVSICAKARACGIHVIVSTQRPSTDVITGTVKANLSTRVSLMAASSVDSITILDEGGAEDLLGNGDMLVKSSLISRNGCMRLQGCFIKPKETAYIVNYLKKNYKPEYLEEFLDLSEKEEVPSNPTFSSTIATSAESDEEKYQWIKEWALTQDYVSMSKIQRECSVGFNKAGKIVRRLQDEGILDTVAEGSNRGFKVIGGTGRFNTAPDVGSGEQSSGGGR